MQSHSISLASVRMFTVQAINILCGGGTRDYTVWPPTPGLCVCVKHLQEKR